MSLCLAIAYHWIVLKGYFRSKMAAEQAKETQKQQEAMRCHDSKRPEATGACSQYPTVACKSLSIQSASGIIARVCVKRAQTS